MVEERKDIRCITSSQDIWEQAKELAALESRSVSSFLREVIKKEYRNIKKRKEALVG